MNVNVSPITAFNSFTVSNEDGGKMYRPGTHTETVKARAKFIKHFKNEGFTVIQETVSIQGHNAPTTSELIDELQAEERASTAAHS